MLVFTAFRETLAALADRTWQREGIPAAVYHGSLTRSAKEAAMAHFRDTAPVLLSTESAGEGRNLQFCHVMINVDLPWNPMQIEQRVGRLHRVGQVNDVLVTNLVARDTIEQQILSVLEAKINLFELVVGELDMILGRVDDDFDFETSVFDAFLAAAGRRRFPHRLEDLGGRLADARSDYIDARGRMDELVGGRAVMTVADPGLDFWLQYVSAEGGLHERVGDSTLVLLPETLQDRHEQSRGHDGHHRSGDRPGGRCAAADGRPPAADRGRRGGAGRGRRRASCGLPVRRRGRRTPSTWRSGLRDQLAVDHGRIDLTGGPRPAVRTILRVSSLVTFALSTDDQFQEQIECWIDVPSRLPFADEVGRELSGLLVVEHAERDQLQPDDPEPAAGAGRGRPGDPATGRATSRSAWPAACGRLIARELARARDYYEQVADSLRRRMSGAARTRSPPTHAGWRAPTPSGTGGSPRSTRSTSRRSAACPSACTSSAFPHCGSRWTSAAGIVGTRSSSTGCCRCAGSRRCDARAAGRPSGLVAGKSALGCRGCQPQRA